MPNKLEFAKELRKQSTDAEELLWSLLRLKQLDGFKFRRQQPIDHFIVNFVCFETRIVIEVDGGQHLTDKDSDTKRGNYLNKQGFRILRFWNHEVLSNVDGVLEVIRASCLHPLPLPPSRKGRGKEHDSLTEGK